MNDRCASIIQVLCRLQWVDAGSGFKICILVRIVRCVGQGHSSNLFSIVTVHVLEFMCQPTELKCSIISNQVK